MTKTKSRSRTNHKKHVTVPQARTAFAAGAAAAIKFNAALENFNEALIKRSQPGFRNKVVRNRNLQKNLERFVHETQKWQKAFRAK